MEKLNKETQKVMTEGEQLKSLVASDGWAIVRRILNQQIIDIGDIFQLTDKDNLKEEIGARQIAIEVLRNVINEVEGRAQQHQNNSEFFRRLSEDTYIHREE